MKKITDFSRSEIRTIAKQYSRTDDILAIKYQTSLETMYRILEKAIIQHIVSTEEIELMKKKAISNASSYASAGVIIRVQQHYDMLMQKRNEFLFSKSEAVAIIKDYLSSPLTLREFCDENYLDTKTFLKTLIQVSVEKYINNKDFKSVLSKFLIEFPEDSREDFTNILTDYRKNFKDKPLSIHDIYDVLVTILK